MNEFMQLGITDTLTRLLYKNGIKTPTEIQRAAIPAIFKGRDIVGRSETGTGKTYVYLRTIFELYKNYGFSKFIIVVPSIAIKEGVYKSLQITKEHFQDLFDNTIYKGTSKNFSKNL